MAGESDLSLGTKEGLELIYPGNNQNSVKFDQWDLNCVSMFIWAITLSMKW